MCQKKPQNEAIQRTHRGQTARNFVPASRGQRQRLPIRLITFGTRYTGHILTVRNVIVWAVPCACLLLIAQIEEGLMDKLEKYQCSYKLKRERKRRGWSRAYVAECIGVEIKTVSRWERGESFPQSRYHQDLVKLFGMNAVNLGLVQDEDSSSPSQAIASGTSSTMSTLSAVTSVSEPVAQGTQATEDWGEAPHVETFYGRQRENETLTRWILEDRCRMIAVLGIGGIGKTTFTTTLARQISHKFAYVIWRSLQNAPPVEQIIASCLQFAPVAAGTSTVNRENQPSDLNKQLILLHSFLREHRCLIILDNVESIFETGQRAGHYVNHYDGYGMLFQLLGETDHQSCLLLTSREKPKELVRMEGSASRVRILALPGIGQDDGQQLLKDRDLSGSPTDWAKLIKIYAGNPLALKLVAEPIHEIFNGDIAGFLAGEEIVLGDIHDLITQQFQRLTLPEKQILYNLAIEREPTSRLDLLENMRHAYPKTVVLLEALGSLRRRSLVEISEREYFTLQPVIREYVSMQFVEQISLEIVEAGQGQALSLRSPTQFNLLNMQPVLKALAKDYIRKSQEQQIIEPILQNIQQVFGHEECITHLKSLLASLHKIPQYKNSYAAGTLLNLLTHLGADLRGLDCSHLAIRQAYLQGVSLPDINFQGANLTTTIFTDTFSSILCVAASPSGQMLAAGTTTNEVRLWQLDGLVPLLTSQQFSTQTARTIHPAQTALITRGHTDGIRTIAFDPSGRLLATGSEDQTIRFWDTGTGECLAVLTGHTDWVRSIAFSPDGSLLASGSEDQTVRLWNVESGTCCQVLHGHTQRVRAIAFPPQGALLASGGDDGSIRLWNTQTWQCSSVLQEHTSYVRTLAFHPTKEVLASGSEDRTIRLWHTPTGICLTTLHGHTHRISALTFADEGRLLASSSDDLTIRLWDVQEQRHLRTLSGHTNRIWSLASLPRRCMLLVSAAEDQTLRLWDLTSGACIHTLRGYTSLIKAIAYSPDGHLLADATEEQVIHLWDVDSGHSLRTMGGHNNRIRAIAFSPDGQFLASGSEDETIRLWNAANGSCLRILTGHTHLVRSVAWSPDGKTLVSCSYDQTIRLWNCVTGENFKTLRGHDGIIWTVAVSHDGTLIASGSDDTTIRLWDIQTGTCLRILTGHSHRVWCVTFSPDDTLIASTSDDGTIRIWERTTGRCIREWRQTSPLSKNDGQVEQNEPKGHTAWTRTISFSPDGRYLASGSHDQTVCIWEVSSGQCRFQLVGHSNAVWSVAFSPTEPILASAGDDGTIRLWQSETGTYIKRVGEERLCERMNITGAHGLSAAQKQALLSLGAIDTDEF
jgi:WD40 repeat protein/DNA-binding XRE family transcriptional regulator